MGHVSEAAAVFWNLIHGIISKKTFLENLKAESEQDDKNSVQRCMPEFLEPNPEHFSPPAVNEDRPANVSLGVDGLFRVHENLTDHQVLALAIRVKGIRLLAQMTPLRRTHVNIPALPDNIMSLSDDQDVGLLPPSLL
jgi:hypothetical protein